MRYLVTGGHGRLGKHLCPLLDCIAPTHKEMDILDKSQLEKFLSADIDAVIHLAAICDRQIANSDKELSYKINAIGTGYIANLAAEYNKKMIYISTERVFDGITGNYKEDDTPNPFDWYGFTKLAGEYETRIKCKDYLIIRTSFRPIKWPFPTAFSDVVTTADYVDNIAQEIALCLKLAPAGIVHIGTLKKSFFDLAIIRNPNIKKVKCTDTGFGSRLDLNINKWQSMKNAYGK